MINNVLRRYTFSVKNCHDHFYLKKVNKIYSNFMGNVVYSGGSRIIRKEGEGCENVQMLVSKGLDFWNPTRPI